MPHQRALKTFLIKARANELKARSAAAAIASLLLAGLFEVTVFQKQAQLDLVNFALVTMLGLLQWARFRHARATVFEPIPWLRMFSAINFFIALSWTALLSHAAWVNSGNTVITSLIFIICGGLIAAAAYSLSISKFDFLVFQSLILSTYFFSILVDPSYEPVRYGAIAIGILFFAFLVRQRKLWSQFWHQQNAMHFELQRILDAFPGGISVIDKGVYKRVNKYVSGYLLHGSGLNAKDIIGQEVAQLRPDSEVGVEIKKYIQTEGMRPRIQREVEIQTPKGPRKHLLLLDQLIDSEQTDEVVAITIDIHEQKQIEKELEEQRQLFVNKSKMAALGEMSSGLAHEINNPLTIIGGRIMQMKKLLQTAPTDLEKLSHSLSQIEKTTDRIAKVIKGLRSFARDATDDPFELTELQSIVKETVDLCESRFKNAGVDLKVELPDQAISLECQATQISQVLLNALNNSFDAIQPLDRAKWIEVKVVQGLADVTLTITDCGDGIPIEVRDKILAPFFTTKPVGKGTGLGLSLSLGLIELHGGTLAFNHSHPNTQLVIRLPLKQSNQKPKGTFASSQSMKAS